MARMPGVSFIGIASNSLMLQHDIVCVHTIVGRQTGGNAAHFTTGGDGNIVQARDTRHRSEANLNGNWHVIAIENEDKGEHFDAWFDSDVPRFTEPQAESIAKILAWCHTAHDIPLELIPNTIVGHRGIAYHRQGCDGNYVNTPYKGRVDGGERWSRAYGKVCPGEARIEQLIEEIIPRARELAGLEVPQMNLNDPSLVAKPDGGFYTIGEVQAWTNKYANMIPGLVDTVNEIVAQRATGIPVEIDYDRIIDGVVDKLSTLEFRADAA